MTEHRTVLPDGRTLALAGYGDPAGPPVALLPCAPGSRLLDPDPAATAAAGVRLLGVDRPGYGASDPLPPGAVPTAGGLADDVAARTALGAGPGGVIGWSGGARVALAPAARLDGMLAEAFRQGPAGIAVDLVSGIVQPAGFAPGDVVAPVTVSAGADDGIVPPEHADRWADRLPAATVRVVPAAGHLLPLVAWAEVLAAVT